MNDPTDAAWEQHYPNDDLANIHRQEALDCGDAEEAELANLNRDRSDGWRVKRVQADGGAE